MIFGFADIWLEKVLENPFCRLTTFLFLELLAYTYMRLVEGIKHICIANYMTNKNSTIHNNENMIYKGLMALHNSLQSLCKLYM